MRILTRIFSFQKLIHMTCVVIMTSSSTILVRIGFNAVLHLAVLAGVSRPPARLSRRGLLLVRRLLLLVRRLASVHWLAVSLRRRRLLVVHGLLGRLVVLDRRVCLMLLRRRLVMVRLHVRRRVLLPIRLRGIASLVRRRLLWRRGLLAIAAVAGRWSRRLPTLAEAVCGRGALAIRRVGGGLLLGLERLLRTRTHGVHVACFDLRPQRPRHPAVTTHLGEGGGGEAATAMIMSTIERLGLLAIGKDMVAARLDGFRRE